MVITLKEGTMEERLPGQCAALTKAGDPCRNQASEGSIYCHIHGADSGTVQAVKSAAAKAPKAAKQAAAKAKTQASKAKKATAAKASSAKATTSKAVSASSKEAEQAAQAVTDEVKRLSDQAKKQGHKAVSSINPSSLAEVLRANIHALAAYVPSDTLREMLLDLETATSADLVDPQTWIGLLSIIMRNTQAETKKLLERAGEKVSFVPGANMLFQLGASVVESPADLLDVETWKGAAVVLNSAFKANLEAARRALGRASEA
jgi:uncharacterized Zn finger protein (UPF0148 family)